MREVLLAKARAVGKTHPGLIGGHRETLIGDFLSPMLPRRFSIGRGMVFGIAHRSKEADIVIWDSSNYPSLQLQDHQLFFSESARVVVEAKSNWSTNEFENVLIKCEAVRNIVPTHAPNIADKVARIEVELHALQHNRGHDGILLSQPHTATAGFFFFGGSNFDLDFVKDEWLDNADDSWPDVLILLEPGIVVAKHYVTGDTFLSGEGYLEFIDAKEDCLLVYTAALIALMNERSVQVEDPNYLSIHIQGILSNLTAQTTTFSLTRPAPGRVPLWRS